MDQAGQFASAPMMDPTKNPNAQQPRWRNAGQQPAPKRRSRRKPSHTTERPRTVETVEHPPTEKPVLKVETPEPNKYAPKKKIGTPTLGRSPNYVDSVGLGKLKVETANGYTDV